ncbi:ABC transporter permease [Auraticoccus monumenti]|uniref:Transport permease protein n=1 Tax=Auraticoccus monumenti TaxID=675864 RepID=A0A1G6WS02_9ACTN|nr:ABC transporter permease [Auraticoccus monumenti]SDD67866.1 ABC-2 type transport system permease protein [Auraticoccus monumenti]
MTSPTSTLDRPTDQLRRLLADTWTITLRDVTHWRNRPGLMAFGWLFPVLMMAVFIGLLGGALGMATGGSYLDFVMPGIFAMTMFFGLEGTMMAVSADASRGVTDRFRSLPISGLAVVAGRCVADMVSSVVGLAVTVLAGLGFGWRPDASVTAVLAALVVLLLLRFAMLWVGIFVGLRVRSHEGVTAVQVLVWPLLFLSSVFVDTSTMPRWLGTIADANPLSATATAVRQLLGGVGPGGRSWFTENAVLLALACPAVLVAVFLPLSALGYRHLRR